MTNPLRAGVGLPPNPTAIIYCEGNFGRIDGKTANGLVRHSETYRILAVIDSQMAGHDAGMVLDGVARGIPVCANLSEALAQCGGQADLMIVGMAPASGRLIPEQKHVLLSAIRAGLHLINGLHEFLNDDAEFARAAADHHVSISDIRRPPSLSDLRMFSGRISSLPCRRIAVLGTDGAVGKRTTAVILTRALNDAGIKAVMVGTGQTGLMQGARHGLALDAIPCQYASGEVEAAVVEAWEAEHPEVIVIEGQGALSHPAYLSSAYILRGSQPQAVLLQHAPMRHWLSDFPQIPMPTPASEIALIETFASTRVIGLCLNHEGMGEAEVTAAIALYGIELGLPATDALKRSPQRLVDMVVGAFPELQPTAARLGS
ncbi:MAG: DUF1611 domain-containing protein [Cyanobacteria bacterium]|nr:DUF1611 domain-containing protein [Cyanobacteriota bacterium]